MELGIFLLLLAIASVGFFRQSYTFLAIGITVFFILAIILFAKMDIVQTENVKVLASSNSTTITNPDNSTSTTTQNNYVDAVQQIPVVNQYHNEIGWLMMLFAFAQIFLLVRGIFAGLAAY